MSKNITISPHYLSKSAAQRVKDPLPIPHTCRYCEGKVSLVTNDVVYNGEQ